MGLRKWFFRDRGDLEREQAEERARREAELAALVEEERRRSELAALAEAERRAAVEAQRRRAEELARAPVVEFSAVEKTFDAGTRRAYTAIKGVSFRIDDKPGHGEFIAIIGPSGCGKSTVLNLIQGFPDVYPPTAGSVRVRGHRVIGPGIDRGMIFQRYSSFPHRTVLSNVTFGLELNRRRLRLSRSEMEDRAMDLIRRVGLEGHERKYPHQLSGGQQQRVAIARALVNDPAIIFADEPTGNLDSKSGEEVKKILSQLNREGKTIIMVTHESDVATIAKKNITLIDGKLT
jgi:ABC-type lipoprotein export system ATPase subunit